jgi:glucose-6-phosphate-specific signal transduction histidine kinase
MPRRFPNVPALSAFVLLLTIYRCIQEGVTNAIRHGKADTVRVDLFEKRAPRTGDAASPTLQLLIQDDGRGILPNTPLGFGLTAMRERVQALGGVVRHSERAEPRRDRARGHPDHCRRGYHGQRAQI